MRKLKLPGRGKSMPKLDEHDIEFIDATGIKETKSQAGDIVDKKLKNPHENNRVPAAGNPVYKAMHACNCSSRIEISKTHRIPEEKTLSQRDVKCITNLLTRWVAREYNFYKQETAVNQRKLDNYP